MDKLGKHGVYRWTKNGPDDHWARVEVRLGEWTDLSKADYDTQQIEPTFWALREEDSWREDVIAQAAAEVLADA